MTATDLRPWEKYPSRRRKTDKAKGKHGVLDALGLGWHTAINIAARYGRSRTITGVLLLRAMRKGLVERRMMRCECCGTRMYEWRRVA